MLKIERQRYISEQLKKSGGILISDISKELDCSEETIRRDLKEMEASNLLIRIHGGAYLPEAEEKSIPAEFREILLPEEKKKMAAILAERYIKPRESIMLDSSTTCLTVAEAVFALDIPVTIITNSLNIAETYAASKRSSKLIMLGGKFNATSRSFNGTQCTDALGKYVADKSIISCTAIDYNHGLLDCSQGECAVRLKMIENSSECIVLADHTKFDDRGEYIIADISRVSRLISDKEISNRWKSQLRKYGVDFEWE